MASLLNIPILHLNDASSWRGGEKQTYYLALNLQRKGYRVFCICQKDSLLHQRLIEVDVPVFPIKMRSELDVFAAYKISQIARGMRVGILHMHTAHSHTLGLISNYFYRCRLNIVSRRVDFRIKQNIFNRMKYHFPDKFISVSNAIRDILIDDGIPGEKVTTVYSGVDLTRYQGIETSYLTDEFSHISDFKNRIKLINVAALTPQKDQETLIRAIDRLVKHNRDIVLFIVGDGELRGRLLSLRDELGLNDYIFFTGFRDDAINLIKFFDIFVMSSRLEGLGTSLIDAMALSKPIIATSTGGVPELIDNGINGILMERKNSQALADAILHLINNRGLQERISEGACKKAQNFSINDTVSQTIDVYNSFIE